MESNWADYLKELKPLYYPFEPANIATAVAITVVVKGTVGVISNRVDRKLKPKRIIRGMRHSYHSTIVAAIALCSPDIMDAEIADKMENHASCGGRAIYDAASIFPFRTWAVVYKTASSKLTHPLSPSMLYISTLGVVRSISENSLKLILAHGLLYVVSDRVVNKLTKSPTQSGNEDYVA